MAGGDRYLFIKVHPDGGMGVYTHIVAVGTDRYNTGRDIIHGAPRRRHTVSTTHDKESQGYQVE
jgi:hypothetical protein